MPPPIALALTLAFIFYLLKRDARLPYRPSSAIWIPTVWMLLIGSRSVTEWVGILSGQPVTFTSPIEDGTPLDRAVFLSLMTAGFIILLRRKISWARFTRNNVWFLVFMFYCGVSIIWSDFPDVAFKRYIKAFGDLMMVMIVLSDPEPFKAIETLLRRCAYFLIPFSVLFIKYYPAYGRVYSEWTGEATYIGVATHKTFLGYICFVGGLYFIFKVFKRGTTGLLRENRTDLMISAIFLCMVVWLMGLADAKTALLNLVVSSCIVLSLGVAGIRKYFTVGLVVGIVAYVVLESCCDVKEAVTTLLGRESTWTGRAELWPLVLSMVKNPIGGEGFESFWLGERLRILSAAFYFHPNQAHNGYLETYLNLGWVGLILLAGLIGSFYQKLHKLLLQSVLSKDTELADFARFGMGFLIAYLIFNLTDASMRPLNFLFLNFLVFMIQYPQAQQTTLESSLIRSSPCGTFGRLPGVRGIRQ